MAKGDLSQALREFREALKVHPHDALARRGADDPLADELTRGPSQPPSPLSSPPQRRIDVLRLDDQDGHRRRRRVLVQAAWSLQVRCRSLAARPLQLWTAEVAKRRGKRIATIALARKLAGILYALWRDGTTYELRPQ